MKRENGMQTGGGRKTWVFDPQDVASVNQIQDKLVHHDVYFGEEAGPSTLALVMDKILDDLPQDLADAVRLVHLRGKSLREAGRILNVDHKTVKARVTKGVEQMKARLVDSVWIAEMLRGYIPADELKTGDDRKEKVVNILNTLGEIREQE